MKSVTDRQKTLSENLYQKTENGELAWRLDAYTNKLTTTLAGYDIVLQRSENENNEPIVEVLISNQNQDVVDQFDDTDLGTINTFDLPFSTYWELLNALEKTARRKAVGADEALDSILSELNSDDVPF